MINSLHTWELTPAQAIAIQEELHGRVIRQDRLGVVARIAGVDASFPNGGASIRAAAVVLSYPDLQVLESAVALGPALFPYIPGLLSFREAPAILVALSQLSALPDLLMCDGHGIAHPRRLGIASHLGLICDLPSIGVAKSRLVGRHAPPGEERGDWQPLCSEEEVIGAALRTRPGVKPVYISIGHRVCLETAIELVLRCTSSYRLPEPVRLAHRLASQESGGGENE